jgi:uncharacterized cupredoxin-like copper-binding protein
MSAGESVVPTAIPVAIPRNLHGSRRMRLRHRCATVGAHAEGRNAGMSATIDREGESTSQALEQELHELEEQEEALERRTRSLEVAGPLALILSLFALALGIGAIVIALSNGSDNTKMMSGTNAGTGDVQQTTGMMGSTTSGGMMGSTASGGMMTGAGGHGKFTSAMVSAAAHGKVYVQLGDYWAAPAVSSLRAGKVTFIASNVGRVPHELMVERMPMRFDSPMHPNEGAAQGMIEDMDPGKSGRMTMHLKPGTYMLFCNLPGHYAAGQHTVFKVTSS